MEIEFHTSDLEKCYQQFKLARRRWGEQVARSYIQRINIIKTTKDIDQLCQLPVLKCHLLTGNRKGQYAIRLNGFYRLIIAVKGEQLEIARVEEVSKHYDD